MILIGTNGFQHRDWVPTFYPSTLDPRFWLEYYSRHFGCCELNFTYYRLPEPVTIQDLMEGSRGMLQFVFRVPFRLLNDLPGNEELARKFAASLWPLRESGQLAAVLAQYGAEFGFIRDNFSRLCLLRDSMDGIPLVADFACPEWITPRAAKHLDAERIALACGDCIPLLDGCGYFRATAGLAYVRFQGRNHSRWLKGDGSARHDYLYSRAELAATVPEIRRLERENEKVLVIMNNPCRGQAPVNARMLIELLIESNHRAIEPLNH